MPQAAAPPKPRFTDDPLEGREHPEVRGLSPRTDVNGSAIRLVAVGERGRGTPTPPFVRVVGSLGEDFGRVRPSVHSLTSDHEYTKIVEQSGIQSEKGGVISMAIG